MDTITKLDLPLENGRTFYLRENALNSITHNYIANEVPNMVLTLNKKKYDNDPTKISRLKL